MTDEQYKEGMRLCKELLDANTLLMAEATVQIQKLQAFKDFVHQRLDQAGVPTHPDGQHSKAGCRIGDRLDIVLKDYRGP